MSHKKSKLARKIQENIQLKQEKGELIRFKNRVIGWREQDWPEGFDRKTAELIVEYANEQP